jgi:glycosyltransferase involved in cell wall biosynthesis
MFLKKLQDLTRQGCIDESSRILFVNDGSRDRTWDIIKGLNRQDGHVLGIAQSRNRGHQNAVLAGLMECRNLCDITISIDCDGQDDINAMDDMIRAYQEGYEVVYGVRASRETDSLFKRTSAQLFYKLLRGMGAEVVYNHADYRLMSARVLNAFADFHEVNLFLRGIVPQIGYPSTTVTYARAERFAGESKYPLKKMIAFAADGITSFSVKPIRLVFFAGVFIFLCSLVMFVYAIITKAAGKSTSGWSSLMASIWMLGGIQLLGLGIVGEYIGKIYNETKRRPRFIIEQILDTNDAEQEK